MVVGSIYGLHKSLDVYLVGMTIRPAALTDLPQLTTLFDKYRVFYKKESDLDAANSFLADRITAEESQIFIAEEHGTLGGFVQLYPIFSSTQMKRLWLLNDLFVAAAFRGRGISIQLIDRAKQLVRDTNAVGLMLETAKSNKVGNQLYPRAGFAMDEEHNYYNWTVG